MCCTHIVSQYVSTADSSISTHHVSSMNLSSVGPYTTPTAVHQRTSTLHACL